METGPNPRDPSGIPEASGKSATQPSLVVVGASAGGVEALSTLVSTLPAGFPAPVILAQHLDPSHPSHLGEILARYSRLLVRTVTDQAPLEPGTVYVIPADRNVEVSDHVLRLVTDGEGKRPKPSINLLFSSAAQAFGEQLIAVILTGTGSDGASGAYQVKAAGGVVIIENPETAAYPALPASLSPTTVDFVADLERIGPLLYEILTGPGSPTRPLVSPVDEPELQDVYPQQQEEPEPVASDFEQAVLDLLDRVQEQSNIDFSKYKPPTILRRLHRRMYATDTADVAAYLRYLDSHREEYQRLAGSFLIKVTGFFRDPELFTVLKERVLPDLVAGARKRGNVLRIWSAGCATGEEAYSLAILVSEVLGEDLDRFGVQIFATDVDEDAIEFGRHGIYPAAALAGVSQERLDRYFLKLDDSYQVTKSLRGLVVFGLHDLGLRAPFPHIDLVLCRNVLMYFTKELQTRALQLFAFSLRNDGYLALGSAETASPLAAYFTPVSPTLKLYRRQGERVLGPLPTSESLQDLAGALPRARFHPSASVRARAAPKRPTPLAAPRNSREQLGLLVLGLPVGVVVIDRHYDIQSINSPAMRLLGIFTEPLGEDLIHLAQSIPSTALRAVIDAAFLGVKGATQHSDAVQPPAATAAAGDNLEGVVTVETLLGEQRTLQFTCYPYAPPKVDAAGERTERQGEAVEVAGGASGAASHHAAEVSLVLILIRDVTEMQRQHEQAARTAADQQAGAVAAHAHAQRDLEATAERLQGENERLKAEIERQSGINRALLEGNQTLAATNMDLRGANEDLQLSQEEAEASAEEIKTLNEELQAANEELVTLNEELEATVEELHAANDELQARTHEWQEMGDVLEARHPDMSR